MEIPCVRTDKNENLKFMVKTNQATNYCLESIVIALIYKLNTKIDITSLFNHKSIESLLLLQDSFIYGTDPRSLLIQLVCIWKKYSPLIFIAYSILYYGHALTMAITSCFKRLPISVSLSFLCRCIKHQKELKKHVETQKKEKDDKMRMSLRHSMTGQAMSDDDVNGRHIATIYENLLDPKQENENSRTKRTIRNRRF